MKKNIIGKPIKKNSIKITRISNNLKNKSYKSYHKIFMPDIWRLA
jgi:hypothetical protein